MDPIDVNPLGLPSNSKSLKEKPKMEPIGVNVKIKKKPWYKRIGDTFIAEDPDSVGAFIMRDIVIPTIRDTVYDIITGGLQMAMYGSTKAQRNRRSSSSSSGSYIKYGDYSNNTVRDRTISTPDKICLDDVTFDTSGEAFAVRDSLLERLKYYGIVTVQDLYDVLNISPPRTAMYWGWTDLTKAEVSRIHGAWLLELPRPKPLR